MMHNHQPTIDARDTRLALGVALDVLEWLLVRDKKRLGPQDVAVLLKRIDLAQSVMEDEATTDGE